MAAEPHNPPEPPQVVSDLPCRACGYNLRGLPTSGRCPECGTDVSDSISAERLWTLRKSPPDPAWARQVREGASVSVLAFMLLLAAMMAPPQWSRLPYRNAPVWESPGRVGFLGVACTWWVVAWATVWKLTTRERFPGYRGRRGWVALITRSLATATCRFPCYGRL
jgi:hypothetical protein